MSTYGEKHRVGELRPSQLLYSFGVGSIIDLPNLSVMVMGLNDWSSVHATEVGEERLLLAVQEQLSAQVKSLRMPPIPVDVGLDSAFGGTALIGVPVATFPRWMLCPYCRLLAPGDDGRFQLKTDPMRPDRARYIHTNCTKPGVAPTVLPARFLVACEKGHLDDFPWHYFAHGGPSACPGALRLREFGVSGEATDIVVECEDCKARRIMAEAFGDEGKQLRPAPTSSTSKPRFARRAKPSTTPLATNPRPKKPPKQPAPLARSASRSRAITTSRPSTAPSPCITPAILWPAIVACSS